MQSENKIQSNKIFRLTLFVLFSTQSHTSSLMRNHLSSFSCLNKTVEDREKEISRKRERERENSLKQKQDQF